MATSSEYACFLLPPRYALTFDKHQSFYILREHSARNLVVHLSHDFLSAHGVFVKRLSTWNVKHSNMQVAIANRNYLIF